MYILHNKKQHHSSNSFSDPNRNGNADLSSPHQIQKQPKKKNEFNLSETGNPLDAKPLPGLKNAPPTPAPVPKIKNPDHTTFTNKYSPSAKPLGPVKPVPGPEPRLKSQTAHHGHNPYQVPFHQYFENEEYLNAEDEEDMETLIKDLERTKAEIARVKAIQNQTYG